jgi:hypothetical protein
MSDKIKVAIKFRRLIDREESEVIVSQWEVKNNSTFQKDSTGKYREFTNLIMSLTPKLIVMKYLTQLHDP